MTNTRRIAALLGAAALAAALTPAAAAVASPAPAAGPIQQVPCTHGHAPARHRLHLVCFDGIGTLAVNVPGVRTVSSGSHSGRLAAGSFLVSFRPTRSTTSPTPSRSPR